MFLSDPKSEMAAARQRLHETRREVAFLRLSDELHRNANRPGGMLAKVDAAVVRISRGANERHSARIERDRASRSDASAFQRDV